MSRLLIVAATTGYQTRMFAEAAERLGVTPVLATDRCHRLNDPWGDHAIAVRFHEPERAARVVGQSGGALDGVVAVGDRPSLLAASIAEVLGLRYSKPAAVAACRSKFYSRERFREAGLRLPEYFRAPIDDGPGPAAQRAPFPCVLKPLGLQASRGVIRADNSEQFAAAFRRISKLLDDPEIRRQRDEQDRFLQVESFIPGREFAIEGIVSDGELQVLALFDKPDPLDGPFFEETIYTTPSREHPAVQLELIETASAACRALGLTWGPVHIELRYNDQGAWILEVAARPIGGLCAKALKFDGDMPLEELVVRHALGEDVRGLRLLPEASGVMMVPIPKAGIYQGVRGESEAASVPGITDVLITATAGQRLIPLPEGASYLGFLFARGATPDKVEAALRAAHNRLEFDISTLLPTMRPGT